MNKIDNTQYSTKEAYCEALKEALAKDFAALYPEKRLLAITLNWFAHSVFYDEGTKESEIQVEHYSQYDKTIGETQQIISLLNYIPHQIFDENPVQFVWLKKNER